MRDYRLTCYTLCSEKKHPLTLSFISLWKIFRFPQNLQGVFRRKQVFNGNILATGDVMRLAFVNYGFYRLRQTFDKMFASRQRLCSRKFLQNVSGQWADN